VTLKKKGMVTLDSSSVPAILCKLSFSQDRTVGFGGADLIVPDAVMMENNVLFAEGVGPVLEWGVRSREKPESPSTKKEPVAPGPERFERTELYMEVTLHQILHE
jgi:hypothetical protein